MSVANDHIPVEMLLTRKNQNVVEVDFEGSMYCMVDPFLYFY